MTFKGNLFAHIYLVT